MYDTFWGQDYEKEMRAAADRVILNKYDPRSLMELKEIQTTFWDEVDRRHQCCRYCRRCYNECVRDSTRMDEMLDIVETRRPLLFDQRIDYFDSIRRLVSEEDANPEDHLVPPCESDEISLD